jgi:hypothetical protein
MQIATMLNVVDMNVIMLRVMVPLTGAYSKENILVYDIFR